MVRFFRQSADFVGRMGGCELPFFEMDEPREQRAQKKGMGLKKSRSVEKKIGGFIRDSRKKWPEINGEVHCFFFSPLQMA